MSTKAHRDSKAPDPRAVAAYPLAEAARYLKLPAATLRSWVVGRPYPRGDVVGRFHPLIKPAQASPPSLSFWNLVEAHVLRSMRTEHGVAIKEFRAAIRFAEQQLQLGRLLLQKDLCTHAGELFLHRYGELIKLSASGQLAMKALLMEHLRRVEWDEWQFPVRLYPFVAGVAGDKPIAIDPKISFGRPVLLRAGVSTAAIAERIDVGETVAEVADDYGITAAEVEQAILYERAA